MTSTACKGFLAAVNLNGYWIELRCITNFSTNSTVYMCRLLVYRYANSSLNVLTLYRTLYFNSLFRLPFNNSVINNSFHRSEVQFNEVENAWTITDLLLQLVYALLRLSVSVMHCVFELLGQRLHLKGLLWLLQR